MSNALQKEQSSWDRMFPGTNHYYCLQCNWWYMPWSLDNPAVVLLACPEHEEHTGRLEERDVCDGET